MKEVAAIVAGVVSAARARNDNMATMGGVGADEGGGW